MRVALAVSLCFLLIASCLSAQDRHDKSKMPPQEQVRKSNYKEHVEVSTKTYPSLEFRIGTPVELISNYRPLKNRAISENYYDWMIYRPVNNVIAGGARPRQSGQLVDAAVPIK